MRPKIICITPVKNEEWILDVFLKSASIWADYIILADQNSSDRSREVAKQYHKVRLLENNSPIPNEPERQRMMLDAAREVYGLKLILSIDADELLSPEAFNPDTWKILLEQKPGTIMRFQWATLFPGTSKYKTGYHLPYGYMDDGVEHTNNNFFHGTRVPFPSGHPIYDVTEFKVIHLQYMNPERNIHKLNWYQCLELDNPSIAKDAIEIFRKYHHDQIQCDEKVTEIPQPWIEQYSQLCIDLTKIYHEEFYWYDNEVKKMFEKNGTEHYRKLDIWNDTFKHQDPRSIIDKAVHLWLRKSQPHYYTKARKIDNIIRKVLHY